MKIWTTKDGTKIPYNQLKFNHIYNIIRYARQKGFFTINVFRSTVDNTDDRVVYNDCSNEVIRDMKNELKRRNITHAYYIEIFIDHNLKKVSPVFESREKACEWAFDQGWSKARVVIEYLC